MAAHRQGFSDIGQAAFANHRGVPTGAVLLNNNAISPAALAEAMGQAHRTGRSADQVIEATGLADPLDILRARAAHHGALMVTRDDQPADPAPAALVA